MESSHSNYAIWLSPRSDGGWSAELVAEDGTKVSVGHFDTQEAAREGVERVYLVAHEAFSSVLRRGEPDAVDYLIWPKLAFGEVACQR